MNAEPIVLALIIAVPAVIASCVAPLLLNRQANTQRVEKEQRDNKRQDEVAAKAAEAARLLLAANERVAADTQEVKVKLDVIHTLVNSNMTAAMQAELDATIRELAMMREVIALNQAAGRQPSIGALAAVEATAEKIAELTATLEDRLKQTHVADIQAAAGGDA